MAPRRPGSINPDSAAGNARLGTGRGSNAGRSQPIPKGSLPAMKKFAPPVGTLKPKTYVTRSEKSAPSSPYIRVPPGPRRKQIGKFVHVDDLYERYLEGFRESGLPRRGK